MTSLHEASPTSLSSLRRALVAYAGLPQPTPADADSVMRALAAHEDWYVPVLFADRAWGQTHFEQMLMFPEAPPARMLNVFTDRESAMLADGQPIGVYGGPVAGTRLLRVLDAQVEGFLVNPASPREQQWFISPPAYDLAAGWATALAVERALAMRGNGAAPADELVAHSYQLLLEQSSRRPAQVFLPDIDGAVAVCFTANDRVEEFMLSLPAAARPLADLAPIDGRSLFEAMRTLGAAGLVINAGSDDQTALTREDLVDIMG